MRFYHGETAKRNAPQGEYLRAFEYLETTRKASRTAFPASWGALTHPQILQRRRLCWNWDYSGRSG